MSMRALTMQIKLVMVPACESANNGGVGAWMRRLHRAFAYLVLTVLSPGVKAE
jgi:hypothetical protein